jgi:hypothetical protein
MLLINDIIYYCRSINGGVEIYSYKVIEKLGTDTYIIESLECHHRGANCKLKIIPKNNYFIFKEMVNNTMFDYVHNDGIYSLNKRDTIIHRYKMEINICKRDIKVHNYAIKENKQKIKEIKDEHPKI